MSENKGKSNKILNLSGRNIVYNELADSVISDCLKWDRYRHYVPIRIDDTVEYLKKQKGRFICLNLSKKFCLMKESNIL